MNEFYGGLRLLLNRLPVRQRHLVSSAGASLSRGGTTEHEFGDSTLERHPSAFANGSPVGRGLNAVDDTD